MIPYKDIAKYMLLHLEDLKKNQWHYTKVEESPEQDDVKSWEWALDEMIYACKKRKGKRAERGFQLIGKYFFHLDF